MRQKDSVKDVGISRVEVIIKRKGVGWTECPWGSKWQDHKVRRENLGKARI